MPNADVTPSRIGIKWKCSLQSRLVLSPQNLTIIPKCGGDKFQDRACKANAATPKWPQGLLSSRRHLVPHAFIHDLDVAQHSEEEYSIDRHSARAGKDIVREGPGCRGAQSTHTLDVSSTQLPFESSLGCPGGGKDVDVFGKFGHARFQRCPNGGFVLLASESESDDASKEVGLVGEVNLVQGKSSSKPQWGEDLGLVRQALLEWYQRDRRKLPWRGDPPPWCVDKASLKRRNEETVPTLVPTPSFHCDLAQEQKDQGVAMGRQADPSPAAVADGGKDARATPLAFQRSAYGTWVSEVMLQQTQVERVVQYWTKWMTVFPSIAALAAADLNVINSVWAGLGYYGRARRLQQGANYVLQKHAGALPSDVENLVKIPGVGPYTAGAISSIAFGRCAAAVDGNVIRVFSRLRALAGDATSPGLLKECWALAAQLVSPEEPGELNQSLMELGATVCTPKAPSCNRCPVRQHCKAASLVSNGRVSTVTIYPGKSIKKVKQVWLALAVVTDSGNGTTLLVRRPAEGLLAGQWEFPNVALPEADAELDEAIRQKQGRDLLQALLQEKFANVLQSPCSTASSLEMLDIPYVRQSISTQTRNILVFQASGRGRNDAHVGGSTSAFLDVSWVTSADALQGGVTSGVRKIFDEITKAKMRDNGVLARPSKRKKAV